VLWAVGFGALRKERREPPESSRSDTGWCPIADRERQRSETPVGLSQPTAQMVRTRVALAATFEPSGES
jgi:hypothetical protein